MSCEVTANGSSSAIARKMMDQKAELEDAFNDYTIKFHINF